MKKFVIVASLCIALLLLYAGTDIVLGAMFPDEQPTIHSAVTGTIVSIDARALSIRPIDAGEDTRTVQIRAGAKHKVSVQVGDLVSVTTTLNFNDTEYINSLEILAPAQSKDASPLPQAASIPKGEAK